MNTNTESWEKDSQEKNNWTAVIRKAQTVHGWNCFISILRIGCHLLRYRDFCTIVITQKRGAEQYAVKGFTDLHLQFHTSSLAIVSFAWWLWVKSKA